MNSELLKEKKEIEKLLGEPFVEEIPINLWTIRRSLLFFSNIALASIFFNWKIASENTLNTPIGLLKGINDNHFYIILFVIILYLWSFFSVSSKVYKSRKKIRGTGFSESFPSLVGRFASTKIGIYPENIKQHTLYSFWLENKDTSQQNFQIIKNSVENINQNQKVVNSENILKITQALEKLLKVFGNAYILVALERFDKEFKYHQIKEGKKYFLELILPHISAFSAIIAIIYKLISNFSYFSNPNILIDNILKIISSLKVF